MAVGVGFEDYGLHSGKLLDPSRMPAFEEVAEYLPNELLPLLLQRDLNLSNLSADQQFFYENGFLVKRNFLPHDLLDEYVALRERLGLGTAAFPDYWSHLDYRVFRDLFCSRAMSDLLIELVGEPMGLHLLLTQLQSLERGWHQDDYLNPEDLSGRYVGIWMAVDDVDPDSGPFQCVPGSHRWPVLRRELVKQLCVPEARNDVTMEWCIVAEHHINKSVEQYIHKTNSDVFTFEAEKGDMLIWSGTLMHRGTLQKNPNIPRHSLLGHMSSISRRMDFGRNITRHRDGGYFWEFPMHNRTLSLSDTDRLFQGR